MKLYVKQKWLVSKDSELRFLIDNCDSKEEKELIFSLLDRFSYLDMDNFNLLQNEIADFIINGLDFKEETTQILALAWDDEADSSQAILQAIKHKLNIKGWKNFLTVNKFGKAMKYHGAGRTQIVIIDEFVGSGKTLKSRIDYLKKNITGEFDYCCIFLAGIDSTINTLTSDNIRIFCPLPLKKGISEFYDKSEVNKQEIAMLNLELKLAQKINDKDIFDYTHGYGCAEALYTMEGCGGNTPNSVFPIFWWIEDNEKRKRNTILSRYENGF